MISTILSLVSAPGHPHAGSSGLTVYFVKDISLNIYQTTFDDLEDGRMLRPSKEFATAVTVEDFKKRQGERQKKRSSIRQRTQTIFSSLRTPVTIDDFELLKLIGKGAHGKVLLCQRVAAPGQLMAMKIIKKQHILDLKKLEHTRAEDAILRFERHSFILGLRYAFQTPQKLYFVTEFMAGGELFQHLKRVSRFREDQARFMVACIVAALGHLHNRGFIYRDLKPENVLLDERGFVKLADFGLAKRIGVEELARTFCGTPEYLAPEVILDKGCNRPVDWWALGTLTYELLVGVPPFYSTNVQQMYKNILKNTLKFKQDIAISAEAKDFIAGLLDKAPEQRLGSIADSLEVMNHPWFRDFDWKNLLDRKLDPPYNPMKDGGHWIDNFDQAFTRQLPADSACRLDSTTSKEINGLF